MVLVIQVPRTVRIPTVRTEVNAIGPTASGTITAQ
jgi:hypothetical protein